VDAGGARVDAIAALAARGRLRAVYLTPHHQYPTTVVLAAGRRLELLALARARRFAGLEDDYDHEFHYDGRPVVPLASADRAGVVVYVGPLSKVLAPGLRLGFLVAPRAVVEAAAARRAFIDRQGDHVLEHALAELFEDGELLRHVRRARRRYAERREVLAEALRRTLGGALSFELPPGGTGLWCAVDPRIDVESWHARALDAGVSFQTARPFAFDGRARSFVRLGFARLDERELREAVRRMAGALGRR
jgi:GntR family transcriptional regulator/MocR family aminotransferase